VRFVTTRLDFVRLLGAGHIAAAVPVESPGSPAPVVTPGIPDARLPSALVLSGGGARGAYEAGVVAALVSAAGARDGEPIPGVDAVIGTSVGSVNAYLVATAQYARLAAIWSSIARENLFRFKRRFHAIADSSSGILTRVVEAVMLERGIVTDVSGVLEREGVADFIARVVDGDRTPVIPFLFTATNLSAQRAEVFYRGPDDRPAAAAASAAEAALQSVVGRDTRARDASAAILSRALLASTAIPVLFDPVEMTFEGVRSQYIDGGIADNTPVDIARILAKNVFTVLVDPLETARTTYADGLAIGVASFGIAQRRILEAALRSASLESEGKRLFLDGANGERRAFLAQIFDSALYTIRPTANLALTFADFTSQARIDEAYALGVSDGRNGWQRYERPQLVDAGDGWDGRPEHLRGR
jgi:predicted acylesterase/phospholipase RssA